MVVKPDILRSRRLTRLRVVLSHMVVKRYNHSLIEYRSLRVVLSHMVVKRTERYMCEFGCLRVVLSHMVVKRKAVYRGKK